MGCGASTSNEEKREESKNKQKCDANAPSQSAAEKYCQDGPPEAEQVQPEPEVTCDKADTGLNGSGEAIIVTAEVPPHYANETNPLPSGDAGSMMQKTPRALEVSSGTDVGATPRKMMYEPPPQLGGSTIEVVVVPDQSHEKGRRSSLQPPSVAPSTDEGPLTVPATSAPPTPHLTQFLLAQLPKQNSIGRLSRSNSTAVSVVDEWVCSVDENPTEIPEEHVPQGSEPSAAPIPQPKPLLSSPRPALAL